MFPYDKDISFSSSCKDDIIENCDNELLLKNEFQEFERQILAFDGNRSDMIQTSITINNSLTNPLQTERYVKSQIKRTGKNQAMNQSCAISTQKSSGFMFKHQDTNINTILGPDHQSKPSNLKTNLTCKKLSSSEKMEFRRSLFAADFQKEVDMLDVELCMSRLIERIENYNSGDKKLIATRESSLARLKLSIQKFAIKYIKTSEGMLGNQFNNETNTATKLSLFLPKLLAFHGFDYPRLQSACLDNKGHFSWTHGYTNLTQYFEDALLEDMWTKFWPNSISIKLLSKIITDHFDNSDKCLEQNRTSFMTDEFQRKALSQQVKEVMRQVYVGGLDKYITSEAKLYSEFSCLGPIRGISMSSNLGPDDVALHKGFAFINFELPEASELAIEMNGIVIDRRNISIGRPSQYNKNNKLFIDMVTKTKKDAEYHNRIYITNLNPNWSEVDIRTDFEEFGMIKNCWLPKYTGSFCNRGFCYLQYDNKLSVHMAISKMDLRELGGYRIRAICSIISFDDLNALMLKPTPPVNATASPSLDIITRFEEQKKGLKTSKSEMKTIALDLLRRIYVGNLNAKMTTELQLYEEFSPFGPIRNIDLIYHMPAAYAFIEYEVIDSAKLALEMDGACLHDRDMKVHYKAIDNELFKSIIGEMRSHANTQHGIYVSNLSSMIQEQEIKDAFMACGSIVDLKLINAIKSNKPEKFCYIQFSNYASKQKAMNDMNLYEFKGKKIRIGNCISSDDDIKNIAKRFEPVPEKVLRAKSNVESRLSALNCPYELKKNEDRYETYFNITANLDNALRPIKTENVVTNTEDEFVTFKRKRDVDDSTGMNPDIKSRKGSRWSESGGHGSTYAYAVPTFIPSCLTKCQEKAYMLQVKVSEITQEIQAHRKNLLYDQRKVLEDKRHHHILEIKELISNYKPPTDYRPLDFKDNEWIGSKTILTRDVYIPQNNSINYIGLLLGPKGKFLKAQEKATRTKIYIRGLGSEKVGKKFSKLYTSTLYNTSFCGEQPLHVRIEGKEEMSVIEGEKRIKALVDEITNNPKFVTYLQQQQMQDRVLYANEEHPIDYVPSTFFEDGKWSDRRRLPYEDVLIPDAEPGCNPVALLMRNKGQFLKSMEQATNTKMMIMGRGTNWENDMPPHVHIVGKLVCDVQDGVKRIKSYLQEGMKYSYL